MLINELCSRNSYKAINDVLNGVTLHDLQCIDVLKMIAVKKSVVIYDTGTGKTLLAAAFMKLLLREDPSKMFLMFVKKDQLVQTPEKLKKFAGLSTVVTSADAKKDAGAFLQKNLDGYNVIMLTHNCLHKTQILDKIYQMRDRIAGVVVDEMHELQNFNGAESASVLRSILKNFEYAVALTATPIVTDIKQLARIANCIDPIRYPDARKLAHDLESGRFSIMWDKAFFINRAAKDLGRVTDPRGYVISVSPSPHQVHCELGGVELFQMCKGDGAVNQVNALIELIAEKKQQNDRGLVYISQTTVLRWVCENLDKTDIRYACINGGTSMEVRSKIEESFATGSYDVILTSVTTAIDLDCEYVVFYEFTVLVNQMIGRAVRGLKPKELDVYFIITKDTNEENYFINNIFAKCQLIRDILGKENSAVDNVAQHLGVI